MFLYLFKPRKTFLLWIFIYVLWIQHVIYIHTLDVNVCTTQIWFFVCSIVVVEWIRGKLFYNNWCCKGELCKFISFFFWLIFLILVVYGKFSRSKKLWVSALVEKKSKVWSYEWQFMSRYFHVFLKGSLWQHTHFWGIENGGESILWSVICNIIASYWPICKHGYWRWCWWWRG